MGVGRGVWRRAGVCCAVVGGVFFVVILIEAHLEVNRAAALLDCSARLLKDAVKAGELPGVRIGNRLSLPVAALNGWLDARRVGRKRAA